MLGSFGSTETGDTTVRSKVVHVSWTVEFLSVRSYKQHVLSCCAVPYITDVQR